MNTNSWINFIVKETESALSLLYSYMGFYEELKKDGVAENANKNSDFWRIHIAAVQHTLFIYLGRLSDDTRDGKSFSDFKNYCISNVPDFGRDSFLSRRKGAIEVNPNYLDDCAFPTKQEIIDVFELAKEYSGFLRAECKTVRSKVYAHTIYTEDYEHDHLFKKIELTKIEQALLAMWSVVQHIWQSYHNARTIVHGCSNMKKRRGYMSQHSRPSMAPSNKANSADPFPRCFVCGECHKPHTATIVG